jgi:hypothetical protein
MKQIQITKLACAVSASLIIAGGMSANAQLIYSDTFAGSAQNIDGAPTTGISGVDGTGSGALPRAAAIESTIDGSGNLNILTPGGNGTGDSGYIRFGTIGSPSTIYDWAASPGASAITSAGGMVISFNWTANDTTSGNWIFVEAGAKSGSQTSGGYGYSSPIFDGGGNSGGVYIKNAGGAGAINNGVGQTSGPGFTPTGVNHVVTLDYAFTSFASGSAVSLTAIVDGTTVQTDSFTWQNSYNYLNIGSYQESNLISNLQITTIPEPTTWAMMAAGLGMLVATRRLRRSNA